MIKRKIVYNICYGGFGISNKAFNLLREWGHPAIKTIEDSYGLEFLCVYDSIKTDGYISRTDEMLIRAIEQLGEDANGSCAKLVIEELDENCHAKIEEHDGKEDLVYVYCDCCNVSKLSK
jgi:hypothetical protein